MSKKLEQVLEFLVNGEEDKAKELLHQVFIEKARAIHEEIISADEMEEASMSDVNHTRSDMTGHDDHIEELSDEIEAEEIMGEEADMMDMDDAESDLGDDLDGAADDDMYGDLDDMGGDHHDGDVIANIEDTMGDLERALEELKAEFEQLEGGHGDDADVSDMDGEEDEDGMDTLMPVMPHDEEGEEGDEEEGDEEEGDEEEGEEEEEMDESFTEEDFDDLAEAISLARVTAPTKGEVGSGTYSSADANAASKSPVAKSQTARLGAEPIQTGKGPTHDGYAKEAAPSTKPLGNKDNRRNKATDGMENEQTGNYGAKEKSSALTSTDTKFGKGNTKSPLSTAPRK
jgi:hypothetical protein